MRRRWRRRAAVVAIETIQAPTIGVAAAPSSDMLLA
jgi:hypothetical protein